MNYFKNKNNEIFAYDDEQIEQVNKYNDALSMSGLDDFDEAIDYKENFPSWVVDLSSKIDNLTPITESELAELQKPTQAELDSQKVSEAKTYLSSTDFYFTVDKYATLTEERKAELKYKREDARTLINLLEG